MKKALYIALSLLVASPGYTKDIPSNEGLFPPGFIMFCWKNPVECEPNSKIAAPVNYDEWFQRLSEINIQVNQEITYTIDQMDDWNIGVKNGDCDDYTVTKRDILIREGIDRSNLRVAFVETYNGILHAALIVETDKGQLVLDNMSDDVFEIERAMWNMISYQDQINPRKWIRIR